MKRTTLRESQGEEGWLAPHALQNRGSERMLSFNLADRYGAEVGETIR
jgi:hypothetical protein